MRINKFKLMIIAGHGQGDPGAIGNGHKEANINRDLADRVVRYALSKGINVTLYDPNKNAVTQCRQGNTPQFARHHYCLEIHCNASSKLESRGTMFYIHKDELGWSVEENILQRLYRLGSTKAWDGVVKANRQWKEGLIVQNRCKEQGVSHGLLETFFITNKEDVDWYFNNRDRISEEIVAGIIEGFGLTEQEDKYTNWIGTVKGTDLLNVRTGAGMGYGLAPIGTVSENIDVEIIGEKEEAPGKVWYHIKTGTRVLGWVYSGYIKRK